MKYGGLEVVYIQWDEFHPDFPMRLLPFDRDDFNAFITTHQKTEHGKIIVVKTQVSKDMMQKVVLETGDMLRFNTDSGEIARVRGYNYFYLKGELVRAVMSETRIGANKATEVPDMNSWQEVATKDGFKLTKIVGGYPDWYKYSPEYYPSMANSHEAILILILKSTHLGKDGVPRQRIEKVYHTPEANRDGAAIAWLKGEVRKYQSRKSGAFDHELRKLQKEWLHGPHSDDPISENLAVSETAFVTEPTESDEAFRLTMEQERDRLLTEICLSGVDEISVENTRYVILCGPVGPRGIFRNGMIGKGGRVDAQKAYESGLLTQIYESVMAQKA